MSLTQLISEFGYYAIFIGTFLEGETVLVLGGFAAYRGYLDLPLVILAAFLGTLSGDQLYFYIGRYKGLALLARKPKWQLHAERIFRLLHTHHILLIIGFRFIYGIRTITPFIIGASRISPLRFLIFNSIGGLLWATTVGVLGFVFGQTLELFIGQVKKFELFAFALIAVTGIIIFLIQRIRLHRRLQAFNQNRAPESPMSQYDVTSETSAVWQHHVSAPDTPDGFTVRTTYPNNPDGVEVMLERWEAGSAEPPHSHPGDDMTVVVEGKMAIQFYTKGPNGLVADGKPLILNKGDTGYVKAGRIHDARYLETCKLVYVHDRAFGFTAEG